MKAEKPRKERGKDYAMAKIKVSELKKRLKDNERESGKPRCFMNEKENPQNCDSCSWWTPCIQYFRRREKP
jgi:hypothetical protein